MSFFRTKFDTHAVIYHSSGSSLTGFSSVFKDIAHPATKNKIEGFKFDKLSWKTKIEDNNLVEEPALWNPTTIGIEDKFQSGIGDGDDLQVESINNTADSRWSPIINHGYFYFQEKEHYLFSDAGLHSIVHKDDIFSSVLTTISGGNFIDLAFAPKPGVPVLVRSFKWDQDKGVYAVSEEANCSVEFSQKTSDDELVVRVGDEYLWENIQQERAECVLQSDLKIVFNKDVTQQVGREIDILSYGLADLLAMESLGVTTSEDFQEYHFQFAPIDDTQTVQVILENGASLVEVNIVSEFTASGINEAIVDYDLGILKFSSADLGGIPPAAYTIRAAYTKTFAVEYEPAYSIDNAKNGFDSVNPVTKYSSDGFVFLKKEANNPSSIVLSADLPEIEEDYFGPIYIGNSFAKLVATVLDQNEVPVEGQNVFFELVSGPSNSRLGNDTSSSAFTNADGIAKTIFNPPLNINQMGGATDVISVSSGSTSMFIEDYFPPSDESSLYLFQVHTEDNILGIPKADLVSFYEEYIQEQGTLTSQTLGPKITETLPGDYSWIISSYADFIKWEVLHRALFDFPTPITYETDDLITGKKTVVVELNPDAVNPHTGATPAFAPVQPSSFIITDSGTSVSFDSELPAIGSLYKSYFVIGPNVVSIRAYTINDRTGQKIYSNTIEILIDLSPVSNGSIYVDTINSVPSGLLTNAYFWDQEDISLETIELTSSGLLPIGFRLKSTGITIASALDSITFLDINPLTQPDDTIDHEFTVTI